jgi:hypothetical protein
MMAGVVVEAEEAVVGLEPTHGVLPILPKI